MAGSDRKDGVKPKDSKEQPYVQPPESTVEEIQQAYQNRKPHGFPPGILRLIKSLLSEDPNADVDLNEAPVWDLIKAGLNDIARQRMAILNELVGKENAVNLENNNEWDQYILTFVRPADEKAEIFSKIAKAKLKEFIENYFEIAGGKKDKISEEMLAQFKKLLPQMLQIYCSDPANHPLITETISKWVRLIATTPATEAMSNVRLDLRDNIIDFIDNGAPLSGPVLRVLGDACATSFYAVLFDIFDSIQQRQEFVSVAKQGENGKHIWSMLIHSLDHYRPFDKHYKQIDFIINVLNKCPFLLNDTYAAEQMRMIEKTHRNHEELNHELLVYFIRHGIKQNLGSKSNRQHS